MACEKTRYTSEKRAKHAQRKYSNRTGVYLCEDCGGWHIAGHYRYNASPGAQRGRGRSGA